MGEVAGLVIGGIALASLFDSCMSMLNYIDAGRNYPQDNQQAVLKVAILAKRLERWEGAYRTRNPPSTLQDGLIAQKALQEIYKLLRKAKDSSTPYVVREQPAANTMAVALVTDQIQTENMTARQKTSFFTKVRWSLGGKDEINAIVVHLSFFISNLEKISPTVVATDGEQAVAADALALIQPTRLGASEESVGILKQAAAAADPQLASAISERQHRFGAHIITGNARVIQGDYVQPGSEANGVGHQYDAMHVSGDAKVFNGNSYTDKAPYEGW